jgi:DNA-binding CsgD family transcriptional regulator
MYELLTAKDWESIVDAIYHINSASDVEGVQKTTLSCLQMLIPCYQITFWLETVNDGTIETHSVKYVGARANYLDEIIGNKYDDDPYFFGMFMKTRTYVFLDTEMVGERTKEQSRLYNEVYKKQGIEYGLRAFLCDNATLIGDVALFNSAEDGDFSMRDKQIMEVLAPHIAQALASALRKGSVDISNELQSKLASDYDLTKRESEVVMLLIDGATAPAISDLLCISPSTAKKHTHNIYQKLHVKNRGELKDLIDAMRG